MRVEVIALEITAGATVTVTFDNRDDGIPHNLHFLGEDAGDFATEIEEGPVTQTLEITFDEPGEIAFQCDVHPGQMNGTLTITG